LLGVPLNGKGSTMESVNRSDEMALCLSCGDDACYPHAWEEDGPDHWVVTLCCGNCGVYREGKFEQSVVEDFDVWLDECQDAIKKNYDALMRFNLSQEIDRFAIMLEKDIILPEDF
jgi:hypothetical protein